MITPPGKGSGRTNNLIYFPRPLSPSTAGPARQSARYYLSTANLSGKQSIISFQERSQQRKQVTQNRSKKSKQSPSVSEEGRLYIKTQYVRHIAKAMKNGDEERLYTLYSKFSFRNMRPADKLSVVVEILQHCGLERIGGNPTAGLSLCFSEAFRNGLGNRAHLHDWMKLVSKTMKIRTLERFAAAKGLNDEIRSEADAILINSYIRAAENMCLRSRRLPQDSHRLDHLVERAITILARLEPTNQRLRIFADRILRINRIRADFEDNPNLNSVKHLHPRAAEKSVYDLHEVEISLIGL